MTDALTILHFADLHIGVESNGGLDPATGLNHRVVDFLARLDEIVDYAIRNAVDVVLFAGDAFHTRSPNATHLRAFAERLARLSQAEIPTTILEGNHDAPVMEQRASSVSVFDAVRLAHVQVVSRPGILTLDTRLGPLQIAAAPYPIRQRMLRSEAFRELDERGMTETMSQALTGLVRLLRDRLNPAHPAILLGHFSVAEAALGAERMLMMGRDATIAVTELADAAWDYVALGHIHYHQNLNPSNDPPVVYAGSVERVDFGEEDQPKGFCVVRVEPAALRPLSLKRGTTEWEFVQLGARTFRTIRLDVRKEPDPVVAIRSALGTEDFTGQILKVIVSLRADQRVADSDIALSDAFDVRVQREVERAVRDRLADVDVAGLTHQDILARFLADQVEPDALDAHLKLAEQLMQS